MAIDLKDLKAKWHHTCYGSTCQCGHIERVRNRHRKVCQEADSHCVQKEAWPSSFSNCQKLCYTHNDTSCFTPSAVISFNA